MKHKSLLAMFIAITGLTLTFCSSTPVSDTSKKSAPVIHEAFFAYGDVYERQLNDLLEENLTTEINLKNYWPLYLILIVEDTDEDVTKIQINKDKTFMDFGWQWEKVNLIYNYGAGHTAFTVFQCGLPSAKSVKNNYHQYKKPIYVKAIDSKGHTSNIFTIPEITITYKNES